MEWRPKERISNGLSKISPSLPLTACECALCSEREEERRKKKERGEGERRNLVFPRGKLACHSESETSGRHRARDARE